MFYRKLDLNETFFYVSISNEVRLTSNPRLITSLLPKVHKLWSALHCRLFTLLIFLKFKFFFNCYVSHVQYHLFVNLSVYCNLYSLRRYICQHLFMDNISFHILIIYFLLINNVISYI